MAQIPTPEELQEIVDEALRTTVLSIRTSDGTILDSIPPESIPRLRAQIAEIILDACRRGDTAQIPDLIELRLDE